jgi:glycosyltransferase involved in cell wall biosynthesis
MNILIYPYNFPGFSTIAGGETYLIRLITHLRKSHNIKIITGHTEFYTWEGLECHPQGDGYQMFQMNNDLCRWADVIITHLLGTSMGYNKANQHNKPMIFIAHNESILYATRHAKQEQCHVIYNSYNLRDKLLKDFGQFNSTVLHPLLPEFQKRSKGKHIALVNCNHNKGGHIFIEIARRLPQYNFIGVLGGYGEQYTERLPNVTYLPNGTDMAKVYGKTHVLLVPSEFESFSQCAIEAMQYGIPVIANPTVGIQENLSNSGIYISRSDIDKYVAQIVYLYENPQTWQRQSDVCFDRAANVAEKSRMELEQFDGWLNKIK